MQGKYADVKQNIINRLKEIIPDILAGQKIDIQSIQQIIDDSIVSDAERYQLSWVGKADAYKNLQIPTTATLAPNIDLSVNWDKTPHLFIEGENLEVLKILQKSYYGKVKMITIDPPYNTGSDSFIYADKFAEKKEEYLKRSADKDADGHLVKEALFRPNKRENGQFHSNWLSMMLPRMFLARNLLRDDGVLFVSIDDHEAYTLKLLLDEVFGEENFCGNIIWNSTKSVTNTALLSVSHTHNLVYFKNIEYHKKNRYEFRLPDTQEGFDNPDNDLRGPWKADPFQVEGERPNQLYEIINPKTGQRYTPNPGCSWKNDYHKFKELMADNRIVFGATGEAGPQRKRFWSEAKERGRVAKSIWTDVDTTAKGTSYLEQLMGEKVFTNPKPVDLIQRFIQLGTTNENDIVLDFFGGSGTTAEAVLRQNIVDNKNRKFIFVTMPEEVDESTQSGKNAKSLGFNTISQVARYRIVKAIEKIKSELPNSDKSYTNAGFNYQSLGFRHLTCQESNFKIWNGNDINKEDELIRQLETFIKTEKDGVSDFNIVFELLIKNGWELDTVIETLFIDDKKIFSVNNHTMIIVTNPVTENIFKQIKSLYPKMVICLDSIFNNNDSIRTNVKIMFEDLDIEFKTI